jgi:hypothetical protein
MIDWKTQGRTVLLEKLTVPQLVVKFPAFTAARNLSLCRATSIQSTPLINQGWTNELNSALVNQEQTMSNLNGYEGKMDTTFTKFRHNQLTLRLRCKDKVFEWISSYAPFEAETKYWLS